MTGLRPPPFSSSRRPPLPHVMDDELDVSVHPGRRPAAHPAGPSSWQREAQASGNHGKEGGCQTSPTFSPTGHDGMAGHRPQEHRPDADVIPLPSKSTAKRRGGLFRRIFGTKNSGSGNNDRSSTITHATHRSSMLSTDTETGDASPDTKDEHDKECNEEDDQELTKILHQIQDGTSTGVSTVHGLVEGRRWDVLGRYLQSRRGRETVLTLDLERGADVTAEMPQHADTAQGESDHENDDNTTNTTNTAMSNPLHLALWHGAPSTIIVQLLHIRPSLAVHADEHGRTALHVACLTAHLDLGLEGGDDVDGTSSDEDSDNEEEDTNDDDELGAEKDITNNELARSAHRRRQAAAQNRHLAQQRLRAQKRRARRAARHRAQKAERIRIFAILRTLIAADPSMINRPEAEGLCCIEIAILCGADNEVVYLLRKCSEAHWKEMERMRKAMQRSGEEEVNGRKLVDKVVDDMVAKGILSSGTAASSRMPTSSDAHLATSAANGISDIDGRDNSGGTGASRTINNDDDHHHNQQQEEHRPPLRRGNSWWRLRKRTTLSDYLSQSFRKAGPFLAADDTCTDNKTDDKKSTKKKKTKKRSKASKPPSTERAYAKYNVPAVAIDDRIFADDAAPFSYAPPAGLAAGGSKSSSVSGTDNQMVPAKMSYEPHPYLTFGSDSDSVLSASSSSEVSGGGIPLRDDDRNTYQAVTA